MTLTTVKTIPASRMDKKTKISIALEKVGDRTIRYSVVSQDEELRCRAMEHNYIHFKHGNVSIISEHAPPIFTRRGKNIVVGIRGSLHDTDHKIVELEFPDQRTRDATYTEVIEAFKAFADNNYFDRRNANIYRNTKVWPTGTILSF
jgi:hypothetical protein